MYTRKSAKWTKHADFIFLDSLAMLCSFFLGFLIRFKLDLSKVLTPTYIRLGFVLVIVNLLVTFFRESHSSIIRRGNLVEFKDVLRQCTNVALYFTAYMYFVSVTGLISRLAIGYMYVLSIPIMYLLRILNKSSIINNKSVMAKNKHNIVILTTMNDIQDAVENAQSHNVNIMALCVVGAPKQLQYKEYPVFINLDYFLEFIKNNPIDGVLLNVPRDVIVPYEFLSTCLSMGVAIHRNIGIMDNNDNQIVNKVGNYTVLTTTLKVATLRQLVLKRLMDIAGGLVGCFFAGIFTIIVGPMIYKADPGPIFYSQTRVGKNGRKFKIYKFRSMYQDAERRKRELMAQNEMGDTLMFKIKEDPRILPKIGHIIRDYSIDEFPQFWNVLKGDMSLVGTRPPTVDEYEQYSFHHKARLATKPGITGMWQTSGRSKIKDFEDIVKLDTEYITNWSLGLDIKLLFKTVFAVLKKEGAE